MARERILTKYLTLRLSEDEHARLTAACERLGEERSAVVRAMILAWLDEHDTPGG